MTCYDFNILQIFGRKEAPAAESEAKTKMKVRTPIIVLCEQCSSGKSLRPITKATKT